MMGFLPSARSFVDEAGGEDVDALAEIHRRSFPRPWSGDDMAALLAETTTVKALALRQQPLFARRRAVGFVMLRSVVDEAEILTIAVDPAHRGRGHGRRLLEEAARRLYRDHVRSLFLEVEATNHIALGLYLSLGFEQIGERAGYYLQATGEPGTALVMRLQLR